MHTGLGIYKRKKESKKTRTRPRKHACVHAKNNSLKKHALVHESVHAKKELGQENTHASSQTLVQESVHEKKNLLKKKR